MDKHDSCRDWEDGVDKGYRILQGCRQLGFHAGRQPDAINKENSQQKQNGEIVQSRNQPLRLRREKVDDEIETGMLIPLQTDARTQEGHPDKGEAAKLFKQVQRMVENISK